MADVEWLGILARDDISWAVISQDKEIVRNRAERAALKGAGVKFFYFVGKAWARMTTHEQAWRFLRIWPDLVEHATNHRAPLFEVSGPNLKIQPHHF